MRRRAQVVTQKRVLLLQAPEVGEGDSLGAIPAAEPDCVQLRVLPAPPRGGGGGSRCCCCFRYSPCCCCGPKARR